MSLRACSALLLAAAVPCGAAGPLWMGPSSPWFLILLEPCRLVHERVFGLWLPAGLASWFSEGVPAREVCFLCVSSFLIPPAAASKSSWRLQCPLPTEPGFCHGFYPFEGYAMGSSCLPRSVGKALIGPFT